MKLNSIAQLSLAVLSILVVAPVQSFAATPAETPFFIAVNGGFGNYGTTFVARNFSMPEASKCSPWTGYTKTADTVIFITGGTVCLSDDSLTLTVSVSSTDPQNVSLSTPVDDYITLTRMEKKELFSVGTDQGYFAGSAVQITCSKNLLNLPATHA